MPICIEQTYDTYALHTALLTRQTTCKLRSSCKCDSTASCLGGKSIHSRQAVQTNVNICGRQPMLMMLHMGACTTLAFLAVPSMLAALAAYVNEVWSPTI